MDKDFEYVDLVFENCNAVRLEPRDVISMGMWGITEDFWINIVGQVILGVPTHTWLEIMDTINYMIEKVERHKNLCCNAVLYMPLPGSELK